MKKHFTFPKDLELELYHHMQCSVKPMTLTGTITPGLSGPGFRIDFGPEASLALAQSAPAVSHDTTRHSQIVVALNSLMSYLLLFLSHFMSKLLQVFFKISTNLIL